MNTVRGLTLAALALALAGCQQQRADGAPSATANASTAPSRASASDAAAAARRDRLRHAILDARGLSIGRAPGTAQHFAFGAPRAAVEAAGDAWLGTAERSANEECGAGPMAFTRYGGLTLNWQDDRLVGWFAREDPAIVTSDGIVPGKLLRDLEVARSARLIKDSTLEGEFDYLAADGHTIGGFVRGTGRDATIESLYAGVNCFFR
ncbi:aspartate-semialdehyde dehydrogenase [Tsuneonella sp. YG55]|uniref:Aspartate-semialdehyde dehydrogenase n=1 Tax=Tsuneonella litorea TaxID=2976475 RepID=A0A9X3AL67_9SPHN|nr:aspartate-semialdehyde dehydrogenase [Tsuneonella litorea]MCT2558843.1 aspartate-semialdehyde dehydrogenase [Tsuneonella litorea]